MPSITRKASFSRVLRAGSPVVRPSLYRSKTAPDLVNTNQSSSYNSISHSYTLRHPATDGVSKNMDNIQRKSVPFTPSLNKIANSEIQQGRPCLFIYTRRDNLENLPVLPTLGFEYLKDAKEKSRKKQGSFDPKSLYDNSDLALYVCMPQKPENLVYLPLQVLEKSDPDGSLLMEILTLNTTFGQPLKGSLSISLLAATFATGIFGKDHQGKGQLLLQSIPSDVKDTALTYGLSFAAEECNLPLCEMFLKWGANPNSNNYDDGTTPLEAAILEPNIELTKLLLKYGADPDVELVSGSTCRELAKSEGLKDIAELFILHSNLQ